MTFTADDARHAWNTGADAWDEFVESGKDYYRSQLHGPALLELCGDIANRRVLDLGCGQGWFSRWLARGGASVVGTDLSPEMLAHARRHETTEPFGIEYVEADAAAIDRVFGAASFDVVTACMSFHDMADPPAAVRAARAVLRDDGKLVFSIPHPFSEMPHREWKLASDGTKLALEVDRYFDRGPATLSWNMSRLVYSWDTPRWLYTLSGWTQVLKEAGFVIADLVEPRPTEQQVAVRPELEDARRLPYFLLFDCRIGATA